jgi:hypothetical protein
MPEAAIYEEHCLVTGKNKIRLAGKTTVMDAETEA